MRKIPFIILFSLLFAGLAFALSYKQYDMIEGNANGTVDQTQAVSMEYPHTRVVFDYVSGADMATTPMTVYYQILDRGDWISAGSPDLNGTTESDLVIDIDTEGITDVKLSGNATCNATIFQWEDGMAQKFWQ